MANQNPTGGERAVPLDLPANHLLILRDTLADCLEGVRGDLETPEGVKDPEQAREEADAYQRLLAGLARGQDSRSRCGCVVGGQEDRDCRRRGEQLRRDCRQP
jgi:hypothetical protein